MDYQKIDDNFIQEIRINLTITNFVDFKINNKNIVPEELTHIYLKKNFIIDQKILEHYYVHSQFLISNSEYSEKVNHGLMTPKWKLLEPYSIIIGNAYYSRIDLLTKLEDLLSGNFDLICGDKKVEYLSDLLPYFKEYSKGFEHGFNEFDNDQVKPFLTMFPEKNDYLNKVFDFVTKRVFPKHDWANITGGFEMKSNFETSKYIITGGFEDGKTQGYFYRAWSIIFSSNNLFVPLFQQVKTINNENGIEQNKINFTNNFDSVDENDIYRYFYDELVKKKRLTDTELNDYLVKAFQECIPPKKRFKLKNVPTKGKVISIFYKYFKEIAQRPYGKQEQYASLLGEYFEGYKTSTIKTNFSK
jgi:hypothetical protein